MKDKENEKLILGKSKTCMIDVVEKINERQCIANIISIRNGGRVEPIWFTKFRKENDKRWDQQMEFNKQQLEFNKQVIKRLDKLEENDKIIFDILKRNNLK